MLQLTCVASREGLAALRPEWDALWLAAPDRTPFQHFTWASAWWDAFGAGTLRVVCLHDQRRLVAIAPLYVANGGGACELRVVGAGVSDYLDVLIAPGATCDVVDALARALDEPLGGWTFCGFDHLRPGSALLQVRAPDGAADIRRPVEPCPVMPLPACVSALPSALGARLASEIRYGWRRARRTGDTVVEHATAETAGEILEALFAMHTARWRAKGAPGVLGDPAVQAFHRAAVPGLFEAGVLRLYRVRVGGRTAAVYYGFVAADRAYFYIGGFDPAFSSIGPGKLAIAAAIEGAIEDGASSFDFLGGRERYKYEWPVVDTPRFSRHLTRPSHRATRPEASGA